MKGEATFVGLPDDQGSLKDCRPRPGVTADGKRVLKELALKYSSGARLTLTLHYSGDSEPKLVGARVGGLEGAEKVQAQADWASAFSKGLK